MASASSVLSSATSISALQEWVKTINASSEAVTLFLFVFGMAGFATVFIRFAKYSKAGSMRTGMVPPISNTIWLIFVSTFCLYLLGYVKALDQTVFYGMTSGGTPDPLSWTVNDTVTQSTVETLMQVVIKKFIQLCGLFGVTKGLMTAAQVDNPKYNDASVKKVVGYTFAGIALIKIDLTITLFSTLFPLLSPVAEYLSS